MEINFPRKRDDKNKLLILVIERLNKVEKRLAGIIADEIAPAQPKRYFVEEILLNGSIVTFASKVKLFRHLAAALDGLK